MKVTAFVGSPRKNHTYHGTELYLKTLQSLGSVEWEIVQLSNYTLNICQGCKLCCDRGEELCPLNDQRDLLIQKMDESEGIIFASPNYSFHVTGLMKVFLDRLAFLFHRPRYFGKTCSSIVSQGVYGAASIHRYFDFIGNALGCSTVNGATLTTLEPISEKQSKKNEEALIKAAQRYHKQLIKTQLKKPTLFEVIIFRISRSSIKKKLDEAARDYNYYMEKGWFESDYYYPSKLNLVKKAAGRLTDLVVKNIQ